MRTAVDTVPWGDAERASRWRVDLRDPAVERSGRPVDRPADWAPTLRAVLSAGEQPTMVAQPIVELGGGAVVGYEMLSRFAGPPDAPPDVWFAEADRRGYGPTLTARAVDRALLARRHLPSGLFLTVNVHPHLVVDPLVREALLGWGALDRVVVELTGAAAGPEPRSLPAVLDELRRAGARVALDVAGTGEAALRRLVRLAPDIIRLDRHLVAGLDADPTRRAVVEALGEAGGRIDARVLAEGVETPAELRTLAELGVPLGQGWLVGRPAQRWPRAEPAVRTQLRRVTRWTV